MIGLKFLNTCVIEELVSLEIV